MVEIDTTLQSKTFDTPAEYDAFKNKPWKQEVADGYSISVEHVQFYDGKIWILYRKVPSPRSSSL